MESSNQSNRIGQAISLYGLEIHCFQFWLNQQDPENIKVSQVSVINHDINDVSCHMTLNWSPNTPNQTTFPIHFQDLCKSMVLLPGDLYNLDNNLLKQWQEKVMKHIVERRMVHQNNRPAHTEDEKDHSCQNHPDNGRSPRKSTTACSMDQMVLR